MFCNMAEQDLAHRLPFLCNSCYAVGLIDGTVAAAHLQVVVVVAVIPDEGAVVDELQLLQRGRPLRPTQNRRIRLLQRCV